MSLNERKVIENVRCLAQIVLIGIIISQVWNGNDIQAILLGVMYLMLETGRYK